MAEESFYDFGGHQTGIHKNAYGTLVRQLGLPEDIEIMDGVQQLARPSEQLLERFHVDTRWKGGIVQTERGGRVWHDLIDEFGVRWSMRPMGWDSIFEERSAR